MSGEYISVTIGASNWGNFQKVPGASALEVQSWENPNNNKGKRQVFLKLSPQGKQPMSWVQVEYDSLVKSVLISEMVVAIPVGKKTEITEEYIPGYCQGCVRIEMDKLDYGQVFPAFKAVASDDCEAHNENLLDEREYASKS